MALRLQPGHFFGQRFAERRTAHLNLVLTAYSRGEVLPSHGHERPYLVVALEGGFRERHGARHLDVEGGALLLNAAGGEHGDVFEAEHTALVNVELDDAWLEGLSRAACSAPRLAPGACAAGRRATLRAHLVAPEPLSAIVLEGLCAELLARAAGSVDRRHGAGGPEPAWMAEVEALLRSRLAEPPGLSELARAAGVSPSRLTRTFRAHRGCSIGAHLRRLRVEHARTALRRTRRSLSAIALGAGFADQSHMTREFRRLLGVTPGALRRGQ